MLASDAACGADAVGQFRLAQLAMTRLPDVSLRRPFSDPPKASTINQPFADLRDVTPIVAVTLGHSRSSCRSDMLIQLGSGCDLGLASRRAQICRFWFRGGQLDCPGNAGGMSLLYGQARPAFMTSWRVHAILDSALGKRRKGREEAQRAISDLYQEWAHAARRAFDDAQEPQGDPQSLLRRSAAELACGAGRACGGCPAGSGAGSCRPGAGGRSRIVTGGGPRCGGGGGARRPRRVMAAGAGWL